MLEVIKKNPQTIRDFQNQSLEEKVRFESSIYQTEKAQTSTKFKIKQSNGQLASINTHKVHKNLPKFRFHFFT